VCWLVGEAGLDQVHEISGLVGRKSECAELRNALDDAANGRGRLLLISGEPGIGKTRLADEFSSVASACHAQVLWGRCWEGAGAPAYWPWIQAIKSMEGSQDLDLVLSALAGETHDVDHWSEDNREVVRGGEVRHLRPVRTSRVSNSERVAHVTSSGGDLEQERFRLFTLVADSFREAARLSPLALVLDDLHDADHSSLLMLKFIARELRDARVAIVGTYREVEVERSKALSSLMARIAREGTHLPLRGLAESDIADFVAVRLGTRPAPKLVTMLRDATDGNPLFLDGVVRMLLRKASSEMRGRLQPPSSLFRPAYGSQFEGKSTRCQSRRRSCCRSRPCLATNSTFVLWSASRLLVEVCSTALTKQSQQEF
jgi:predicted ATPase